MDRIKKPRGLIRYSSQAALQSGKPVGMLRPRVLIYAVLLLGLALSLVLVAGGRPTAEVTVLRGLGAPFTEAGPDVINQLRLKIGNRSEKARSFSVSLVDFPSARLVAPELPLTVKAGEQAATSFFVVVPRAELHGSRRIQLRVGDGEIFELVPYTLLGPEGDTAR
jgi:polyferredoxin